MAGFEGNLEALALYAGQSAGLTDEVQPAGEVVEELVSGTEERIDALGELVE